MAKEETDIVHRIMVAISQAGGRVFKNVRGMFVSLDGRTRVKAGLLAPGAPDLIGFVPVVVTSEMVGRTVAVFCALEVKTATGRDSAEQRNFVAMVKNKGGMAAVVRSPEGTLEYVNNIIAGYHGLL